jgi:RNA polymerase-interacting CarD/CdnL/TRCF family regulator
MMATRSRSTSKAITRPGRRRKASFGIGDWLVHLRHGVGQIVCIERKLVHGQRVDCYRLETQDSVVWIPLDNGDNERLRALASPATFRRVLGVLRHPPQAMDDDSGTRKRRINEVLAKGAVIPMARLIRDLWGRKAEKRLNETEITGLRQTQERLVREWSVSTQVPAEEVRSLIQEILGDEQRPPRRRYPCSSG